MKKKILSAALALAMALSLVPAAFAAGGTAYASTQSVEVDGKKVEFQMYALRDANGNPTNYVKLRDVAHVLNGTKAQFAVGYDGSISVTTGTAYTDVGGEMSTPYSGDRAYRTGSGAVKVNGQNASLESIILTDDAGGDYTYFKLRDLGSALGFKVDWTADRGVIVETEEPSVPSQPTGIVSADGKLSVNDLQGVWSATYGTYGGSEYIISGDQITLLSYDSISDMYRLRQGTITGIEMDVEPTFSGDDNYPYAIKYTYTDQTLLNGKLSNDSRDGGRLCFTEVVPAENYFKSIATRYDRVSSSQLYDTVLAAIEGPKKAEEALSKYPTYAFAPKVPDFGAIFGMTPTKVNKGLFEKEEEIRYYNYSNDDADRVAEKLYGDDFMGSVKLAKEYTEILLECGFTKSLGVSVGGDQRTYYKGYGYTITIDTSGTTKIGHVIVNNEDFFIMVQKQG